MTAGIAIELGEIGHRRRYVLDGAMIDARDLEAGQLGRARSRDLAALPKGRSTLNRGLSFSLSLSA
jgi:hypothetical protein